MSPSTPKLSKEEAIAAAEKSMGASFNDQETQLNWVMKADNTASLAHVVQVQNDESDTFGEAFVDAQTGEVLAWTDFISHATVSYSHRIHTTISNVDCYSVPCPPDPEAASG
jgi:Zn-dependent metalloprotease